MADCPPKIPVTISGVGPDASARIMEKVADELGLKLVFQPGSNPTVIIQIGAAVKDNHPHQTTTSIGGDINDSSVVIGSQGVTVFFNRVDSSRLPDDVKCALKDARNALEATGLSPGLKEDVAGDLDKVASELQKAQPDEGRVKHLLRSIKEVAAPVASALSIAASLAKLLG